MRSKLSGRCRAKFTTTIRWVAYDANGNITKRSQGTSSETWKYGYDTSNHLISVDKWSEDPDVFGTAALQMAADYKYDPFGNRIEKLVDDDGAGANAAVTTRFALDGWNPAKTNPRGTENSSNDDGVIRQNIAPHEGNAGQ